MNRAKRSFMPRISLSTLMLLVVVLAVLLASGKMEESIENAKTEVYPLRYLANELRVHHPNEYVVVGHFATRTGELVYSVHIPDDGEYEVCLATDEIPQKGLVEANHRIAISPGAHRVELKIDPARRGSAVQVLVDEREVVAVDGPDSWKGRKGSMGGLQHRTSTHYPADRPLILVRQRFGPDYSKAVGPGVLLWIQQK